jgi:hypothetical protein
VRATDDEEASPEREDDAPSPEEGELVDDEAPGAESSSEEAAPRDESSATLRRESFSPKTLWSATLGVLVTMLVSRLFFDAPWQLLSEGNTQAWIGVHLSAPALGAAAAVLLDTRLDERIDRPRFDAVQRTALGIVMLVVYTTVVTGFQSAQLAATAGDRAWSQLGLVMVFLAITGAMSAFFWQGLVQARAMSDWPAWLRVTTLAGLQAAVLVPLGVTLGAEEPAFAEPFSTFLSQAVLAQFGAAMLFESGVGLASVMSLRAMMGIAYAWAYQVHFEILGMPASPF